MVLTERPAPGPGGGVGPDGGRPQAGLAPDGDGQRAGEEGRTGRRRGLCGSGCSTLELCEMS